MTQGAMQPRPASKPPATPAPLIDTSTSSPSMALMGDVINNVAAPFQAGPDPAKGALGQVEHVIGAVMGVVGAPFELMDTGFALATAPIAALVPGMPAAVLMMPHLGTPHGHAHPPSLIPPNPVPVPLPSIGTVMCAGCVSVTIGGTFAARAGDVGLAVTCGSLSPAFEIYTGSSNTWIGGSRAARMTDITRHCNPASALGKMGAAMGAVGLVAGAAGAGGSANAGEGLAAAMQAAQVAADAAALAMSALLGKDPGVPPSLGAVMLGNPTVLIGGFPLPDLMDVLGAALKGLKKLGDAAGKSPTVKKLLAKVGLCNDPGEPISTFSGAVYNDFDDYTAQSGFSWQRHYRSSWNEEDGPLGHGFRHFYDRRLLLLRKRALYEAHDGEQVEIPLNDAGTYVSGGGFALERLSSNRYKLLTDRDEELEFVPQPTSPPSGRLVSYKKGKLHLQIGYDDAGRIVLIAEAGGASTIDTRIIYDEQGRISEVQRGARYASASVIGRYAYANECLVAFTDALGATVRIRYDDARRMAKLTDRRGYSFHWHYDPQSGRCVKSSGDDGLWGTEATYRGNVSTFKEPDGGEWTYKHFDDGIVSHLIDPLDGVLEYVRDEATGRITKQILPGGVEYTWVYDSSGKLGGRLDPWDNSLPTEDEDPSPSDPLRHDGPVTQKGWHWGRPLDKLGEPLSGLPASIVQALKRLGPVTPANAVAPEPVRDAMGRVLDEPAPDGFVRHFQYDAEGNCIAERDSRGHVHSREIVSWDLVGTERTPLGNATRYAYTHREEWRSLTDPNANRTEYARDRLHRVTEVRRNGTPLARYAHDAHNRVIRAEAGDGRLLFEAKTNPLGLPASRALATGQQYTYAYDENGNRTKASSDEHEVDLAFGRRYFFHPTPLPQRDARDGKGIRHGYNGKSQLSFSVYFERFAVEYRDHGNGQLRVHTPDGATHEFWRTADGKVCRKNGNGTSELTVFDHQDRLAARVCWNYERALDGPTWTSRYQYDGTHRLTTAVDSEQGPAAFEYDADGRVTSETDGHGTRTYEYDPAGNLSRTPSYRQIEHGPDNIVERADFDHFEHDSIGRLVRRDLQGGVAVEYAYDSLNQLVEVAWSDREERWRASYDGLGRRLWREYGGQRTDFFWDGDRLVAERAPTGTLRIYVYTNADALLPFMWLDYAAEASAPESGNAHYVFYAPNGMPLRVENQNRETVWRATSVHAYGVIHTEQKQGTDLRLRFAGHFHDEHTGLFYNRHRDYDPTLGRYLQLDPIGHEGGINLYGYTRNPGVEVDLRGLSVHIAKKKADAPHADTPLNEMTEQQLKDTCKFHADALADAHPSPKNPKPERAETAEGKKKDRNRRNMTTFSVGVIESVGPDGKPQRRLVATNNMNNESRPGQKAREHMTEHGIKDGHGTPPQVTAVGKRADGTPITENTSVETGEPFDKSSRTDHHAEQRMGNVEKAPGEKLVAQSPSQGCCEGCHGKLSQPGSDGKRPIDQIPEKRQRKLGQGAATSD